jgi:hypothetical protein
VLEKPITPSIFSTNAHLNRGTLKPLFFCKRLEWAK